MRANQKGGCLNAEKTDCRVSQAIDRVIVFDNENLKIEWKFDVAFQLS